MAHKIFRPVLSMLAAGRLLRCVGVQVGLCALLLLAGCSKNAPEPKPEVSTAPPPQPAPQPAPAPEPEPSPVAPPVDEGGMRADQPLAIDDLPWLPEAPALLQASGLIERKKYPEARKILKEISSPGASLLRARIALAAGALEEAQLALDEAAGDALLGDFVALEQAAIFREREEWQKVIDTSWPIVRAGPPLARRAVRPLSEALLAKDPQALLDNFDALTQALPHSSTDGHSRLLEQKAAAQWALGQKKEARATNLQRFLEQPVSPLTPEKPPAGTRPTAQQLLARAERLQAAHRNERVIEAMNAIDSKGLSKEELCRLQFGLGLAHRKLHHYTDAERLLGKVADSCADEDLARRAMYLQAKVVSIKSGLRAVAIIERFNKRFPNHSMSDDVLFWAGDLYQRRNQREKAEDYYKRIEEMEVKGDHCADARWRMAWMAYLAGEKEQARARLERLLLDDGCAPGSFDRSRAAYWLGRLAASDGDEKRAAEQYQEAMRLGALGYYAQLALTRLVEQDPQNEARWKKERAAPVASETPAFCPGWLAEDEVFAKALDLLMRGLGEEAALYLRKVAPPEQKVVGKSHAIMQGLPPQQAQRVEAAVGPTCDPSHPGLLLALLLDRSGAQRDAHWRLRTEFAELLDAFPGEAEAPLFRAAYPLAYRDELGAAEKEHGLPEMFLQALSREESAFDAYVVSWAGAYGLTQLLLSTGQRAGELLDPPVDVKRAEDLLDPTLNARLGGAHMAALMKRFKNNPALSLIAYNASESFSNTLWKRHAKHDFDHFVEEITIRETRGYVKRVLKTYGIYRWLYRGDAPMLPVAMRLPKRGG